MTTWQEWKLSTEWSTDGLCPNCGHSLIITEFIRGALSDDDYELHNGICYKCRKQYTVQTEPGTLTVNADATLQQDRIDALEERVARLEAIVQKLLDTLDTLDTRRPSQPSNAPQAPKDDIPPLLDKYRFLLG